MLSGHVNHAAERAFWLGRARDDSTSDVTVGVQASQAVASRPDCEPKRDPAGVPARVLCAAD